MSTVYPRKTKVFVEEKILVSDTYLSGFGTTEQVGQPGQQFVKVDYDVRAGGFDALADEQDASGECRQAHDIIKYASRQVVFAVGRGRQEVRTLETTEGSFEFCRKNVGSSRLRLLPTSTSTTSCPSRSRCSSSVRACVRCPLPSPCTINRNFMRLWSVNWWPVCLAGGCRRCPYRK